MERKKTMVTMMVAALISVSGAPAAWPLQETLRFVTNYPNPFDSRSEETTISYALASDAEVKVKIYDLFGMPVREFPASMRTAGIHEVPWDGTNELGQKVARGGYLCVIEIANEETRLVSIRKIAVIH